MEQNQNEEIDIISLLSKLWNHRRTIIIVTAVFTVLGFLSALTTDHKYTSKIVFVPQFNSSMGGKISSLAAMAGISLDDGTNDGPISPMVYPMIMQNKDLLKELIYTPMHFKCSSTPITFYDYVNDPQYQKTSFLKSVKKYTLGLPGLLKGVLMSLKKDEDEGMANSTGYELPVPILTKEEDTAVKILKNCLELSVVKTEKHLTLTATMKEPIASAELAENTYGLLKKYISSFKVAKSESNLEYIETQYAEAKADYEAKQEQLARFKDSNLGRKTASASLDLQKLSTEAELARMLYLELSKNRLTAKVKLSEANVALTEITPAYVPRKSSNSRTIILLIWIVFGGMTGCGYVLGKDFVKSIKDREE